MILVSSFNVFGNRLSCVGPCRVAGRGVQGFTQVGGRPYGTHDVVANVRTIFQTKWCCLEMIGSLEGAEAERAAKLAVHQEFYANRARILLSLVKHMGLHDPDDLPFTIESLEKIRKEDESGNRWAALKLTTHELLAMTTKLLGGNSARKAVAEGIDAFRKEAKSMCDGELPTTVTTTVRVCTGEMFSRISVAEKVLIKESGDSAKDDFGFESDTPIKIGIHMREAVYLECHQVLLDLLIDHARTMDEIKHPKVKDSAFASVKIMGGRLGPLDERISIFASGPGLAKLRQEVMTERRFFTVHNGSVDPFEDIEEKNLQATFCRVVQNYLNLPIPKRAWFSVLGSEGSLSKIDGASIAEVVSTSETSMVDEESEFLGLRVNSTRLPAWKWVAVQPHELAGLICGLSEYICDDFEIQSRSQSQKCMRYPKDSPVRICWTPSSSSMELSLRDEGILSIDLDQSKLGDIQNVCDEVIRRLPHFVRLAPPPSFLSSEDSGKGWVNTMKKAIAISFVMAASAWVLMRSLGGRGGNSTVVSSQETVPVVVMQKDNGRSSSEK